MNLFLLTVIAVFGFGTYVLYKILQITFSRSTVEITTKTLPHIDREALKINKAYLAFVEDNFFDIMETFYNSFRTVTGSNIQLRDSGRYLIPSQYSFTVPTDTYNTFVIIDENSKLRESSDLIGYKINDDMLHTLLTENALSSEQLIQLLKKITVQSAQKYESLCYTARYTTTELLAKWETESQVAPKSIAYMKKHYPELFI